MLKKIILLAGPTASGKSRLAIKIAKKIGGEIINADSMQVYKEFSVLSARPSIKDLDKIKHHLYGFLSVKDYFSSSEWLRLAKQKIKLCIKNKKVPILVGGTGLYFNAIIKGISKIPEINLRERDKIRKLHQNIGQKKFYEKLQLIDPLVKDKINPSDVQRTIRAYEVKKLTKKSLYEWAINTKSDFSKFDIKKVFLNVPRDVLLKNINKRITKMFDSKCINEVSCFLNLNIDRSLSANKMIGVNEITNYLSGISTLEQVKERINIKTRQYAKSQNTWARGHMSNWSHLYFKDFSQLYKKILKVVS